MHTGCTAKFIKPSQYQLCKWPLYRKVPEGVTDVSLPHVEISGGHASQHPSADVWSGSIFQLWFHKCPHTLSGNNFVTNATKKGDQSERWLLCHNMRFLQWSSYRHGSLAFTHLTLGWLCICTSWINIMCLGSITEIVIRPWGSFSVKLSLFQFCWKMFTRLKEK